MTAKKAEKEEVLWPNQTEPVDGVVATSEVSQDPDFFEDDDLETDLEMED